MAHNFNLKNEKKTRKNKSQPVSILKGMKCRANDATKSDAINSDSFSHCFLCYMLQFLFVACYMQHYQTCLQLTACSCHVMYPFQSKSTLYSWLNVKELVARIKMHRTDKYSEHSSIIWPV